MTPDAIELMLHFGYVPRPPSRETVKGWAHACAPIEGERDDLDVVDAGVERFDAAFGTATPGPHVVPLSGGLDSRAILGALLARGLRDDVVAVTVGTPGTYDFELGRRVASAAGVRHHAIDLGAVEFRIDRMIERAAASRTCMWLFGAYFLREIDACFGDEAIYWSGFMGDPLAGSHLLARDSPDWTSAVRDFAARAGTETSIRLTSPGFRPEIGFPERAPMPCTRLTFDEQVDFLFRQEGYVRPTVLPAGLDVRTPFLDPDWVDFMTGVPRRHREGQALYRRILDTAYPDLFALPTKAELALPRATPKWRRRLRRLSLGLRGRLDRALPFVDLGLDPRMNYVDWDRDVRDRADLRSLVEEAVVSLRARDILPGLDPTALFLQHVRRRRNLAAELTRLLSLEVWLRVEAAASASAPSLDPETDAWKTR